MATNFNFLGTLTVAVAWCTFDGVAIHYVLPVLRMTSCFHTMGPIGRIKHDVMFRRSSPGGGSGWASRQLRCLVVFFRTWRRGEVCRLRLTCSVFVATNLQQIEPVEFEHDSRRSAASQTDPRNALRHARRAVYKVNAQCDKLVTVVGRLFDVDNI